MDGLPIGALNQPIAISAEQRSDNALASLERNLPRFTDLPETGLGLLARAALVSGGPSLAQQMDAVRDFSTVIACGSVYDYLAEHGVSPRYCVIFDPGADHARFYHRDVPGCTFLVSSTCDPSVFDALEGRDVRVWHPYDDLPQDLYGLEPRVGGGSSVTLRAIALAHIMGFREQHLFGFDCSFSGGVEHAYPYNQDRPATLVVNFGGELFPTTPALLQQAQEFAQMYFDHQHGLACILYGDGLAAKMWRESSLVNIESPLDA